MLPSLVLIIGLALVSIAAVFHVAIFSFESITWSQPNTWKRFGVKSQEDADTVKPMAFNQGFYNLFLAIGIFVGVGFVAAGQLFVGCALILFGALSMVGAATVLVLSNPKLARAALLQGAAPLLGSILVIIGCCLATTQVTIA